jgi:hypothetical protein
MKNGNDSWGTFYFFFSLVGGSSKIDDVVAWWIVTSSSVQNQFLDTSCVVVRCGWLGAKWRVKRITIRVERMGAEAGGRGRRKRV